MIKAIFKYAHKSCEGVDIDTTTSSGEYSDLSPFKLSAEYYGSKNFENLWQFSKVYDKHWDSRRSLPNSCWYSWRQKGFSGQRAVRYPMGKGAKPVCSWWNGQSLKYIDARKQIYVPLYAELVGKTESYKLLEHLYFSNSDIILRDYDAYDHEKLGMTLVDVINNESKICGHAFVLIMMLTGKLDECVNS